LWSLGDVRGVEGWVRRNGDHRTPSGRERSSGKVSLSCAADRLAGATCVVAVWNVPLDGRCTIHFFAVPIYSGPLFVMNRSGDCLRGRARMRSRATGHDGHPGLIVNARSRLSPRIYTWFYHRGDSRDRALSHIPVCPSLPILFHRRRALPRRQSPDLCADQKEDYVY